MRSLFRQGFVAILIVAALASTRPLVPGQQAPAPGTPKLGEAAPDFALSNIEGKRVQLKDYRGKKNVVLVFYPAMFRTGG